MSRLAAVMLTLIAAGCGESASWPCLCQVFTDCEGFPSKGVPEAIKRRLPDDEALDRGPSKRTVERYHSDDCDEKCARKRAERDHARRQAAREYDERLNRDWLPADDPRRWQ
jgi:hypothetical protein